MRYARCDVCNTIIDAVALADWEYGISEEPPEYPCRRKIDINVGDSTIHESAMCCSPECVAKFQDSIIKKYNLDNVPRYDTEIVPQKTAESVVCEICRNTTSAATLTILKAGDIREEVLCCSVECQKKARARFVEKHGLQEAKEVTADRRTVLTQIIANYTDLPVDTVKKNLENGVHLIKQEWLDANPQTSEEKIHFYKTCKNYMYDLGFWHTCTQHELEDNFVTRAVVESGNRKVLEYGCGIGDNAILLASQGIEVVAADLGSYTLDFCKFRIKVHGLEDKITVVPIDEPFSDFKTGKEWLAQQKFDAITCFDVLEHLGSHEEIRETIMWFKSIAKRVYGNVSLDKGAYHPMHIGANKALEEWIANQLDPLVADPVSNQ